MNLWLSLSDTIPMPEIGWGNQFGETTCKEYAADPPRRIGAEDCAAWSARQGLYRDQIRKLFVREWLLAPDISTEVFATEAYHRALEFANERERPALTKRPGDVPALNFGDVDEMESVHSGDFVNVTKIREFADRKFSLSL